MRLLVCGSRTWTDAARIDAYIAQAKPTLIIHGGARGADTLAGDVAQRRGIPLCIFPAEWAYFGNNAGAIRNEWMLIFGKPDRVVAFWDGASPGTASMCSQARLRGVSVDLISAMKEGAE